MTTFNWSLAPSWQTQTVRSTHLTPRSEWEGRIPPSSCVCPVPSSGCGGQGGDNGQLGHVVSQQVGAVGGGGGRRLDMVDSDELAAPWSYSLQRISDRSRCHGLENIWTLMFSTMNSNRTAEMCLYHTLLTLIKVLTQAIPYNKSHFTHVSWHWNS